MLIVGNSPVCDIIFNSTSSDETLVDLSSLSYISSDHHHQVHCEQNVQEKIQSFRFSCCPPLANNESNEMFSNICKAYNMSEDNATTKTTKSVQKHFQDIQHASLISSILFHVIYRSLF